MGEFYGGNYIDVYTIKESVEDGATVALLYDEGIAKMDVRKEELDEEFEEKAGRRRTTTNNIIIRTQIRKQRKMKEKSKKNKEKQKNNKNNTKTNIKK